MITLCCLGLPGIIYVSAILDIYFWCISLYQVIPLHTPYHHFSGDFRVWCYVFHYITPSFNWLFFPRLGRRFSRPLMCYAQPGLHDILSYSLYSRPFQMINSGSHQVQGISACDGTCTITPLSPPPCLRFVQAKHVKKWIYKNSQIPAAISCFTFVKTKLVKQTAVSRKRNILQKYLKPLSKLLTRFCATWSPASDFSLAVYFNTWF